MQTKEAPLSVSQASVYTCPDSPLRRGSGISDVVPKKRGFPKGVPSLQPAPISHKCFTGQIHKPTISPNNKKAQPTKPFLGGQG